MSSSEEAIVYLTQKFKDMGIESLIVGASARDIVATKFGLPLSERRTSDVDFAILVKDWAQLKEVEESLNKDANTERGADKGNHVRYFYKKLPFDLVPFGGVEKDNKVSWPPFYDSIMTVLGYQEALSNALEIKIHGETVKVVCPEVLIALKFIAWNENRARTKDVEDIWYLLKGYKKIDLTTYEYALDHLADKYEKLEFEEEFASSIVIGHKLTKLLERKTLTSVSAILNTETVLLRMVEVLKRGQRFVENEEIDQFESLVKRHFEALKVGLS